jgi:hypothetical protein
MALLKIQRAVIMAFGECSDEAGSDQTTNPLHDDIHYFDCHHDHIRFDATLRLHDGITIPARGRRDRPPAHRSRDVDRLRLE